MPNVTRAGRAGAQPPQPRRRCAGCGRCAGCARRAGSRRTRRSAGAATRGRRPVRTSATTSRSIPIWVSRAARARASGCCSTSATSRIRCASTSRPTTNMSFWHSATFSNDGSKVLFTDEWGGGILAALPRHRQAGVGRQRALHDREQQAEVPQLLQAAGAADRAGELRRAQRLAHPDPGPRGDGAGVVPGRHLGLRLDRRRRIRRRSRSSIAVRSRPSDCARAARGRPTGTTA